MPERPCFSEDHKNIEVYYDQAVLAGASCECVCWLPKARELWQVMSVLVYKSAMDWQAVCNTLLAVVKLPHVPFGAIENTRDQRRLAL